MGIAYRKSGLCHDLQRRHQGSSRSDFETKIIEFDDKSEDKIKIFCLSIRPDPYHFTIVIDTIKCPFSIVDNFASLQASSFDNVVKALEEEIIEKKW